MRKPGKAKPTERAFGRALRPALCLVLGQGNCCSEPEHPLLTQHAAATNYLEKANSERGAVPAREARALYMIPSSGPPS